MKLIVSIKQILIDNIKYNSPQGDPRLRKAIQEDYKRNFNLDIKDENIIVFEGPKGSNAILEIIFFRFTFQGLYGNFIYF